VSFSSKKLRETIESVTDDEFKDYVGVNAYKFMSTRENLMAGKSSFSFSWPALLLGPFWAAYRKMWGWFSLYLLAYVFFVLTNNGLIFWLLWLLGSCAMTSNYIQSASKKIQFIKQKESDVERLKSILERTGGTSKWSIVIAFAIWAVVSIILFGFQGEGRTRELSFLKDSMNVDNSLPECASQEAIKELKNLIERDGQVELLDWENLTELSYSKTDGLRNCMGDVVLSNGSTTISYEFSQSKADPSTNLIEIKELSNPLEIQMAKERAQRHVEEKAHSQSTTPKSAFALSPKGREAVSDAVQLFDSLYKESGVWGVIGFMNDCYKSISSGRKPESLIFCIALDISAASIIREMEKSQGFPETPDFNSDVQSKRITESLVKYGIKTSSEQENFIQLVRDEINFTFQKLLGGLDVEE